MVSRRRFLLSVIAAPFGAALARLAQKQESRTTSGQTLEPLAPPPKPPAPVWQGDPLDHAMTLRDFIHSFPPYLYEGHDFRPEIDFFYGVDWIDHSLRHAQVEFSYDHLRPIMNRAAMNSMERNEPWLSKEENFWVLAAIVWRNRDAQRFFSYQARARADWHYLYERPVLYVGREHPAALALEKAIRSGQV